MSWPPLPPFTEETATQKVRAADDAWKTRDQSRVVLAHGAHCFRAYGDENWRFDLDGLMASRFASINEHPIAEAERHSRWSLGRRPDDDHPGLSGLACDAKRFRRIGNYHPHPKGTLP